MSYKSVEDLPHVDINILQGKPWTEAWRKKLRKRWDKTFLVWLETALKLANDESEMQAWMDTFEQELDNTYLLLVTDIQLLHNRMIQKVVMSRERIGELCGALKIDMPAVGHKNLSILQELKQLTEYINKYERMYEVRQKEVAELSHKEAMICRRLGRKPKSIEDPSQEELQAFHTHVDCLESELFKRSEKLMLTRDEIVPIIEELGYQPSSKLEQLAIQDEQDMFIFSDENMKLLEIFRKSIIDLVKITKDEIAKLHNWVETYQNLLDTDLMKRENCRQKCEGKLLYVLETLQANHQRLKDMKKANMKVFFDNIRRDLEAIWQSCHCLKELVIFPYFSSDCYDEELLKLHEIELNRWKEYYEANKNLLLLIEKHKKHWKKLIDLDNQEPTTDRFKNRGGQLLKEEKERNALTKHIPLIENEMLALAAEYEERNGTSFLTFGVTVGEYIDSCYQVREKNKKLKLSGRKAQKSMTTTPGRSPTNPSSTSPHLGSTVKRKLSVPYDLIQKKLKTVTLRTNLMEKSKAVSPTFVIPKITINVVAHKKRLSMERKKRIEKIRSRSISKARPETINESMSSEYGHFQEEVLQVASHSTRISPSYFQISTMPQALTPERTTPRSSLSPTSSRILTTTKSPL